jgi:hypothetical protein
MATLEVPQHMQALQRGNELRGRRAEAKRRLRSGDLSLADAMGDPPPEIAGMLLIDVIRALGTSRRASLQDLGRMAIADRVNLMVPLGGASARSRAWVATHGGRWTSLGPGGTPGARSRSALARARQGVL